MKRAIRVLLRTGVCMGAMLLVSAPLYMPAVIVGVVLLVGCGKVLKVRG